MDASDSLHPENPPTFAGFEPANLGEKGQCQTNLDIQPAIPIHLQYVFLRNSLDERKRAHWKIFRPFQIANNSNQRLELKRYNLAKNPAAHFLLFHGWIPIAAGNFDGQFPPQRDAPDLWQCETVLRILILPKAIKPNRHSRVFYTLHNHAVWTLSILCIMKIHRLGPELNPQPQTHKANDKPTTCFNK
ncbi:hypothetical protein TNCV_3025361 [Trichonephila clavipes]|nr:hypothetical protein TNCV_3025361 [Trichonephila clavipes]